MHILNKTTTFLFVLIAGSTTLTTAFGQGRFSIAPIIAAGYRSTNFNYQLVGSSAISSLTGSGTYNTVAIGLTGFYAFSKHGSISMGLLFSRSSGLEKFSHINTALPVETAGSGADNLQLPVLVNYTLSSHRLSPYLSAGSVVTHTNVDPVASYIISKQNQDDPLGSPNIPPKTVRVQALIGAGVQYQFAPAVALIVQPVATYAFGRPSVDYTQYHVYTLGLQTQLKCAF